MPYTHTIGAVRHVFPDLKTLLARATPLRSGDELAGVAAGSAEERMAARMALADMPLAQCLQEAVVPYESDEVTRLILTGTTPPPSHWWRTAPWATSATGCSPTPPTPRRSPGLHPASPRKWWRQ